MKYSFLALMATVLGQQPGQIVKRYLEYMIAAGKQFTGNVQKTFSHVIYYYNAVAVSKTNVTLFGPNNTYTTTQTNLSAALLGVDQSEMIFAIRCLTGANASLTATDWVPGLNTAETQNGRFNLSVNNVLMLSGIPLTVFNSDGNPEYPGVFTLETPICWGPQEPIQIDVTFDVAPATANTNIRFELMGYGSF